MALPTGCNNEQAAAAVLGFTQVAWDNLSGKVQQPASAHETWSQLTDAEKAAAMGLGYTKKIWDNQSGKEKYPASANKYWSELTSCGESRAVAHPLSGHTHPRPRCSPSTSFALF